MNFNRKVIVVLSLSFLGAFFLAPVAYEMELKGEESDEPVAVKLDLYVMSQCPYGYRAESTLFPIVERFKGSIDFNLYFIATQKEDGTFDSLHGQPEVDENIRQVCAREKYPDKYLTYILDRNKEMQKKNKNWEESAKKAEIDPSIIRDCWQGDEGRELFIRNIEKAEKLQVSGSPTIYFDDQKYEGNRDELSFTRAICNGLKNKGIAPAECADIPACLADNDCPAKEGKLSHCQRTAGKPECIYRDPVSFRVRVVDDSRYCKDCNKGMIDQLKKIHLGAEVEEIAADSRLGKKLISRNNAQTLPLYLLDKKVTETAGYEQVKQFYQEAKDGYIIDQQVYPANVYLDRERKPDTLDLFVMSMCPYAVRAEKELIDFLAREENQDLEPKIHYIVKEVEASVVKGSEDSFVWPSSKEPRFQSLRGEVEVEENLRQGCISKHAPEKFFQYLECRNKDLEKMELSESCMKEAGIKIETINSCAAGPEGEKMLREDARLVEELKVYSSPTFLWENKYIIRQLGDLRGK